MLRKILKNSRAFFLKPAPFFKVLCLTETWFDDRNSESSLYQLPQYTVIHQHRSPSHKNGRAGGISMYIHDSLNFKSRKDLDINTKNVESLSIELVSKNSKNNVVSTIYRPPGGDFKDFNNFLKYISSISLTGANAGGCHCCQYSTPKWLTLISRVQFSFL